MAKLKRFLEYLGIFLVATCLAAGFVILQFIFSKEESKPDFFAAAEDTTFSNVLGNLMNSNTISLDFDVEVSYDGQNIGVNGTIKVDLKAILGEETEESIYDKLELSLDCTILSGSQQFPLSIACLDGMSYLSFKNTSIQLKTEEVPQNIGAIITMLGVEMRQTDILSSINVGEIMGLLNNVQSEQIENGYKLTLDLLDYGTAIMFANSEYMLTGLNVEKFEYEGVSLAMSSNVGINEENFQVEISEEQQESINISPMINFIKAFGNLYQNGQTSGNISVVSPDINQSIDFGVKFAGNAEAYISTEVIGKPLNVVYVNDMAYFNFDDVKIKATKDQLESVVDFVEEFILKQDVNIEETINQEIRNITQTDLIVEGILAKLNNIDGGAAQILNMISFSEDGNVLYVQSDDFYFELSLVNEQVSQIVFNTADITIVVNFNTSFEQLEIVDEEFVDYTFFISMFERFEDFANRKIIHIQTQIKIGKETYKLNIKAFYSNQWYIKVTTKVKGIDITLDYARGKLYAQLNNLKVRYDTQQNKEEISKVLGLIFGNVSTEVDTSALQTEISNIVYNLEQQLLNLSQEDALEYISKVALKNVSNNSINVVIEGVEITLSAATTELLNIQVKYDDIQFDFELLDAPFMYLIPKDKNYVAIDNLNEVVKTVYDVYQTQQISLTGNVTVEGITIPATIELDIVNNYANVQFTAFGKTIYLTYKDNNLYVTIDNLHFVASQSEIESAVAFVVGVLKENNIKIQTPQIEAKQDTSIAQILDEITLASTNNTISVLFKGLFAKFSVAEKSVYVSYDNMSFNFTIDNTVVQKQIQKEKYVDYKHFVAVCEKYETLINSKRADINLIFAYNNKTYLANLKIDFSNGTKVWFQTNIEGYAVEMFLIGNIAYLTVNELSVSFNTTKATEISQAINSIYAATTGKTLDVVDKQEIENCVETIKAKIKELATIETAFGSLEMVKLSNTAITFNTQDVQIVVQFEGDDICLLSIQTNEICATLKVNALDETITTSKTYASLDNLSKVITTVEQIVTNKKLGAEVSVVYKEETFSATIVADFSENAYVSLATTIFGKELNIVYAQGTAFITYDKLKVQVGKEKLEEAFGTIMSILQNNVEIPTIDIEAMKQQIKNININEIISKLILTSTATDFIFKYENVEVVATTNEIILSNLKVSVPNVVVNIKLSEQPQKQTIVSTEYVDFKEYEELYATVGQMFASNKVQMNFSFNINQAEMISGKLAIDYSDINVPKIYIYDTNYQNYSITATIIGKVVYAKVNGLKVYFNIPGDIQGLFDKIEYFYFNFTNTSLGMPNLEALFAEIEEKISTIINDVQGFTFEDFMKIYHTIQISNISNFKVSAGYEDICATLDFVSTEYVLFTQASYKNIGVNLGINKYFADIAVPDLTDYSNIDPLISSVEKFTNTFSTKKFGVSTTLTVMGEEIDISGNVDMTNGLRVDAEITIAEVPVFIKYYDGRFFFKVKGLNMTATLAELKQLFEVDIKKFIETTLDQTITTFSEDLNAMLTTLDFLDAVYQQENVVVIESSMGLDIGLVEGADEITNIKVKYDLAGVDLTAKITKFAGTITDENINEFTKYENVIKLADSLIDYVVSEAFSSKINGTYTSISQVEGETTEQVNQTTFNLDFKATQKDASIKTIQAAVGLGTDKFDISFVNTEVAETSFIYIDYLNEDGTGLKFKLNTTLVTNLVGFATSLFGIDLSVIYDLLNISIPKYDTDVMQGLVIGYETETKTPVSGEQSTLEGLLALLSNISLSTDGSELIVTLAGGSTATITSEIVDGKMYLNQLILNNVPVGKKDTLSLIIDFYADTTVKDIPTADLEKARYMDLSSVGQLVEILVDTANYKRYKLQGKVYVSLIKVNIDVFVDIEMIRLQRDDGKYIWKPYIVAWLQLPKNGTIFEDKLNNAKDVTEHSTRLYILDGKIYVYRGLYGRLMTKNYVLWKEYKEKAQWEVLDRVVYDSSTLMTNTTLIDFLKDILGLNAVTAKLFDWGMDLSGKPNDNTINKMFIQEVKGSDVSKFRQAYVKNGNNFNLLLNGKYLMDSNSIGEISVTIGTQLNTTTQKYEFTKLDLNMSVASILSVEVSDLYLKSTLSHNSYPNIDSRINSEVKNLQSSNFESYFSSNVNA